MNNEDESQDSGDSEDTEKSLSGSDESNAHAPKKHHKVGRASHLKMTTSKPVGSREKAKRSSPKEVPNSAIKNCVQFLRLTPDEHNTLSRKPFVASDESAMDLLRVRVGIYSFVERSADFVRHAASGTALLHVDFQAGTGWTFLVFCLAHALGCTYCRPLPYASCARHHGT